MFVMTASGQDVFGFSSGFGLTTRQSSRLARKAKRGGLSILPVTTSPKVKITPGPAPPDPVQLITTTRAARKMERKAKRGALDELMVPPGPSPVPILTTRKERKEARKQKRGGLLRPQPEPQPCVQGNCLNGYCQSGSMCCPPPPLMGPCVPAPGPPPGPQPPPPTPGPGGCTTSEFDPACTLITPTLGACLQCCSHNFRSATRRACKRECDNCFAGGGGGGGTVPPGPEPVPTQSCGYECVGPTDTGDQQCEYVCHDYPGTPGPVLPTRDTFVPSSTGYGPSPVPTVDEAALMGTEQPAEEQTFIQKYGLWIAGGVLAAGIVYSMGSKRSSRR